MEYNKELKDIKITKELPMIYALAECSIACMNNANCINPAYRYTNREEGTLRVLDDVIMQIESFISSILKDYEENEPLFFTDNKIPKSLRVKIDEDSGEDIIFINEAGEKRFTDYMTEIGYYEYKDSEDEKETLNYIYSDLHAISDNIQMIIKHMYNYKCEGKINCSMFDFQNEKHRAKFYEITNLLGISKCFTFIKRDDSTLCEVNLLELYIDFRRIIRSFPDRFNIILDNLIERKY